jgi:hypothetical protein
MDTLYKFELRIERLDSGGYTSNGRYFGTGQPLYYFEGEVEVTHADGSPGWRLRSDWIRADNRADAKAQIRAQYPKARFYN